MTDLRINHIFGEIGVNINNLTERAQGAELPHLNCFPCLKKSLSPFAGNMSRDEAVIWQRDYKGLSNIMDNLDTLRQLHKGDFLTSKQGVHKLFAQGAVPMRIFLAKHHDVM